MTRRNTTVAAAIVLAAIVGTHATASAQDEARSESRVGVSLMAGLQALNENDTALPDHFINVPSVAAVSYRFNRVVAVEGDFTWMIPVEQSVELSPGTKQDRRTPHMLAYQADVRTSWPLRGWAPYLAAGAGAVTFLSDPDTDRTPQLDESRTMFAVNVGTGVDLGWTEHWLARVDFREFAAFPSDDATGLAAGGSADPIWMERATLGVGYLF